MYLELNEKQLVLFKKIMELTFDSYEIKNNFISVEELMYTIEDLYHEYSILEEKFEDYKKHVNECYRQKTPQEMEMEDI